MLRKLFFTLLTLTPVVAGANEYRGMPAGWPASNVGVPAVPVTAGYAPAGAPAGYALYQANRPGYAAPQAYYAARPVQGATTAYYATLPSQAPTYAQVNYSQPVAAYYSPQAYGTASGYAPTPTITAYSPGVAAGMAPVYGISPQPGTMMQAQRAYYGSAGSMSFAPAAVPATYRAYYAPAPGPVTYYRPVTVYQPATGQPVTCLQAVQPAYQGCGAQTCGTAPPACGTSGCGSSGCGWNLFSWLCNRCSTSGCGTTCGTSSCAPTGCGQQPYYPVVPVNPVVPVQPYVSPGIPVVPAPTTTTPPLIGTPRVPPPPTRIYGPGGAADSPPSLAPGGLPSTTITPAPGTTITPAPGTTIIPGSPAPTTTYPAPTSPYTPQPPGSIPATEYYPPAPSEGSRFDSNRFAPPANGGTSSGSSNTLRFAPPANSSTPNGVKVVPDPDAPTFKPTNQAPQLINPRDRNASLGNPWAVVPAVWPSKQRSVASATIKGPQPQPNDVGGRVIQASNANASRQLNERTNFAPTSAFVRQAEESLDDSGWSSGR